MRLLPLVCCLWVWMLIRVYHVFAGFDFFSWSSRVVTVNKDKSTVILLTSWSCWLPTGLLFSNLPFLIFESRKRNHNLSIKKILAGNKNVYSEGRINILISSQYFFRSSLEYFCVNNSPVLAETKERYFFEPETTTRKQSLAYTESGGSLREKIE